MSSGRIHRTRRSGSRMKNNIWTTVLLDEVLIGTGIQNVSDIVQGFDWSPTGGEHATILTVRGWLSFCGQNDTGIKSEGQIFWYISTIDAAVTLANTPQADAAPTYVQANILATGGHIFESIAGGTGDSRPTHDVEINVKTMRKIRAGQNLILVVKNATGDNLRVGGVLRALLRKGGN